MEVKLSSLSTEFIYQVLTFYAEKMREVDVVNNFFAQVGDKISEEISALCNVCRNFTQLDEEIDSEHGMSEFKLMNVDILFEILKELDSAKSSGVVDLGSNFIFDAIAAIPEVFVKLINLSLISGILKMIGNVRKSP